MAFKRKYRRGRPGATKRRRVMRKSRKMFNLNGQAYRFKRFVYKVNLNGSDAVPFLFGATTFTLSDIPGTSEFQNLFDRYRITGIAYRYVCRRDPGVNSTTAAANQGSYPSIHWVYDWDDSSAPGSLGVLQEYPSYKEFYFSSDKPATRWKYFRPSSLTVGFETVSNSFYRPEWKGLIDMASPNAPFYGIKYATQGHVTGITITMECKYYFVCKNVR